jgi:hypothetical protein
VQVEIAVPAGERGALFSQELFRQLEPLVSQGRTYRGRIISLEAYIHPMGGGSMVKVHRLLSYSVKRYLRIFWAPGSLRCLGLIFHSEGSSQWRTMANKAR